MSEISHHNDDNGNDEFNYSSHDSCPSSCQDRLTVESAVEGCKDRIFCEYCDFGTGGHGGRNVISNENHNWWSLSSTSLPPLHTIKATKQQQKQLPSEQQNRNHFIDCNSFTRLLNDNVICKSCVNAYVKECCKQAVQDFVTYLQSDSAYHISINQKSESFLEKAFLSMEIPCIPQLLIAVSSENLGLASKIQITCLTCQKVIAKLESPRSDSTKGNGEITNKEIEAKHFSINQQFILGCHEAGLGPGDSSWVLVNARKLLCC